MSLSNQDLIDRAASVLNPTKLKDFLLGDVGCALETEAGNVYLGVCMDISSGIGFCAEHSAIAAMVTAGEFKIKRIVAVWRDETGLHVLSPCGRCREFMRQIDESNIHETDVIMDVDKVLKLSELLPYHDWFHNIEK
jgi:cytidine deaminase